MSLLKHSADGQIDASEHYVIPGEQFHEQIVPLFKYETILDQNRSLEIGRPVTGIREVVELRFPQNPQYVPIFLVGEVYRTINGREITYAERWKEQYQAFLNGDQQRAVGTPIDELRQFGATPAQLSLCRASNILTVEALLDLQGAAVKRLGIVGNELKPMADKWAAARDAAANGDNANRIAELEAQVRELLAAKVDAKPAPVAELVADPVETIFDDAYPDKSDGDLKDMIAALHGARPKGNPSRATLLQMLKD